MAGPGYACPMVFNLWHSTPWANQNLINTRKKVKYASLKTFSNRLSPFKLLLKLSNQNHSYWLGQTGTGLTNIHLPDIFFDY